MLRWAYHVANRMMRRVFGRSQPFSLSLSLSAFLFRRVSLYENTDLSHLSPSLLCPDVFFSSIRLWFSFCLMQFIVIIAWSLYEAILTNSSCVLTLIYWL